MTVSLVESWYPFIGHSGNTLLTAKMFSCYVYAPGNCVPHTIRFLRERKLQPMILCQSLGNPDGDFRVRQFFCCKASSLK